MFWVHFYHFHFMSLSLELLVFSLYPVFSITTQYIFLFSWTSLFTLKIFYNIFWKYNIHIQYAYWTRRWLSTASYTFSVYTTKLSTRRVHKHTEYGILRSIIKCNIYAIINGVYLLIILITIFRLMLLDLNFNFMKLDLNQNLTSC